MNNIKDKLFPIILLVMIVISSLVLFFSSGDSQHPEVVVSSIQEILHAASKWVLCVTSILALVYLITSAEHNHKEITRIKNTYNPRRDS